MKMNKKSTWTLAAASLLALASLSGCYYYGPPAYASYPGPYYDDYPGPYYGPPAVGLELGFYGDGHRGYYGHHGYDGRGWRGGHWHR